VRPLYSCSTPSTSSSVAAPELHLQQQLHQKQSIPGEVTVETKTKDKEEEAQETENKNTKKERKQREKDIDYRERETDTETKKNEDKKTKKKKHRTEPMRHREGDLRCVLCKDRKVFSF